MTRLFPFLLLCGLAFSPTVDAYQTSAAKEAPKAEVPVKPLPAGPAVPVRVVRRAGPAIDVPPEISGDVAAFITVSAITDGAEVVWDTPDAGLNIFPSDLLKSTKTAVVSSAKEGKYRLWCWTAIGNKATPKVQCVVTVGKPAPVPPGPNPPDPKPPIPVPTGFRVLFVQETNSPMTAGQLLVLNSTKIRAYLNEKCVKDGGRPGWRSWDKDQDVSKEIDTWQKLWTATKPILGTLPQIVIVTDQKGEAFPLPTSEAAALELLQKYGGK